MALPVRLAAPLRAAATLLLAGCGSGLAPTAPASPVVALRILPAHDTTLTIPDARRLTAVALDARNQPVHDALILWTSSDPAVVELDVRSSLEAVAAARAPGSAMIAASVGDVKAEVRITSTAAAGANATTATVP